MQVLSDDKDKSERKMFRGSLPSKISHTTRVTLAFCFLVPVALLAPLLQAAQGRIEGQVLNGTVNRPVSNQQVQLLLPRGGMQQVATTSTDPRGRFVFDGVQAEPNSFYLLQTVFQGVNYHDPVQFDSTGKSKVELHVYESTRTAPDVRIKSARILVRAEGQAVRVQELFAVENLGQPPRAYVNPDGTFLFRLLPEAGSPTVAVAGLMNMPLPQAVQEGKSPGEFSINYALKPGLTVVMVAYGADYTSGRFSLRDQVPYPIEQAEMYVVPSTLSVDSPVFKPAGLDPESGGQRLIAESLPGGTPLEARLSGRAAPSSESEVAQTEEQVKVVPNSMTRLGVPLLSCFLLVLLWALGVRVAKEWPSWKGQGESNSAQKQLETKVEALLNSLADLDALFAAGKLKEEHYWKERLELKAKLVARLKKSPPALLESYAFRNTPQAHA